MYLLNGSVDDPDIDVIMVNGVLYPVEDGEFSILLSTVHYEIVVSVEDRAGNRAQVRTMMNINPNPPLIGIDEVRRLSEGRYSIEGETRDYVTNVTIDGVRYPVVDGRFSAEVEVDPGTDEVLLVVEDWKGNPWEETVVLEEPTLTGPQLLLVGVVVALAVLVASVAVVRGRKIRRQT